MDSRFFNEIGNAVKKAEETNGDLTTKNLKYVWSVATDFASKHGGDVYELFIEGVTAMKKCELRYDPEKNDNFTKFCYQSILGYMNNYINRQTSLVHIPVNHLQGFKAGQKKREEASVSYTHIDSMDYDTLGSVDDEIFNKNQFDIFKDGLELLDENSKIAIKMKLRLDEYSNIKKNSMKAIAEELEVPVNIASKIYKDAMQKLTKYCRAEMNG